MAKPRWLDDREQHVWQSYLHLTQHLYATLEDQLLRDAGLSGADYKVLHPLSESPGGVLRARELCTEIGWDRSRLSHHVTRMEKRGLVVRQRTEEDKRFVRVALTGKGRRLIQEIFPAHVNRVTRRFRVLSDLEQEHLRRLCRKLGTRAEPA